MTIMPAHGEVDPEEIENFFPCLHTTFTIIVF